MHTDALLVLIAVAVAGAQLAARRLRMPAPTLMFLAGAVLALLPTASHAELPPELVLVVLLPVILFWEGYSTSLAQIRRYWRPVLLLGVPLVVLTAAAAAATAHAFGMSWAAALVLGAVLAPTDASAVAGYARALPARWMTVLRGESLINDGTALVLLGIAIGTAGGQLTTFGGAALRLGWSYLAGAAVGLAVAGLAVLVLRRVRDPLVLGAVSLAQPFAAAVLAETAHASGVVAVVVAALGISRHSRRVVGGAGRIPAHAFWEILTFVVNGGLFVLTGLQMRRLFTEIAPSEALVLVGQGVVVAVVVLLVRLAFVFTTPYLLRLVDRRPRQRALRSPARVRVVLGWAGMRGAVSLAAALSVPVTLGGAPFPFRNEILVITFVVIAVTLLVQGATLPAWIRWARLSADPGDTQPAQVVARLAAIAREAEPGDGSVRHRLRLLEAKRHALADLVAAGELDDAQMWVVQESLDQEEIRLHRLLRTGLAAAA
ncbi:Na+/H+ antiporter [Amycolatopsis sp. NPDC006131]|uniref:Na+/H+ antiporter n=1 Tax=Amycolatopsis sp. NPDC006131 TaxID=3156731 RepID=UPI0033BDF742